MIKKKKKRELLVAFVCIFTVKNFFAQKVLHAFSHIVYELRKKKLSFKTFQESNRKIRASFYFDINWPRVRVFNRVRQTTTIRTGDSTSKLK
jgi:hypothetical protein